MKTVLLTIKTEHLNNIRKGKKTVELRKTAPKHEPPFKVLLCESGSGGNIKGEFICDRVDEFRHSNIAEIAEKACVSEQYIRNYMWDGKGFVWHIYNLIDYHNTKGRRIKHISEFGVHRTPQSWQYIDDMEGDVFDGYNFPPAT